MKSEGAIRHKIKQVRFRYLKRAIEENLARRPENCTHNSPIDGSVRICFAQLDVGARSGVVCDERFDGCGRAATCPMFAAARTKDEIKAGFYRDLDTMTFPEIAYNYPDMAALLWVLADEGLSVPPPDPHEFDLSDTVDTAAAPPAPEVPAPPAPEVPAVLVPIEVPVRAPSFIDRLLGRVP